MLILGVPSDRPALIDLRQRFARRALSPDTVARITRDAIERNRFLVITSWDVRLLYFIKRHLPRIHHLLLRMLSPFLNRLRTEGDRGN